MTVKVVIGILVVLLAVYFLFMRGGDVKGPDARKLVEAGARLVDVRSQEEFDSSHLPGAINIPVSELDRRLGELGPKDQPIVVYCRSGARSGSAARTLKGAGFQAVHNLGPMSQW